MSTANPRYALIFITSITIFLLACDSDDSNPSQPILPPAAILPLEVGNTWKYEYSKLIVTYLGSTNISGEAILEALSKQGDIYSMQFRIFVKDTLYSANSFRVSNVDGRIFRHESNSRYCVYSPMPSECTINLIMGWKVEPSLYSYLRTSTVDTVTVSNTNYLNCVKSHYYSRSSVNERETHEYFANNVGLVKFDVAAMTSFGGYAEWYYLKEYDLK